MARGSDDRLSEKKSQKSARDRGKGGASDRGSADTRGEPLRERHLLTHLRLGHSHGLALVRVLFRHRGRPVRSPRQIGVRDARDGSGRKRKVGRLSSIARALVSDELSHSFSLKKTPKRAPDKYLASSRYLDAFFHLVPHVEPPAAVRPVPPLVHA